MQQNYQIFEIFGRCCFVWFYSFDNPQNFFTTHLFIKQEYNCNNLYFNKILEQIKPKICENLRTFSFNSKFTSNKKL